MKQQNKPLKEFEQETVVARPKVTKPPLYNVFMLNDDFTPMDFVVELLQKYFAKELGVATQIMVEIHTQGKGLCGMYTKDVAETKVMQVMEYAKLNKYPLKCVIEIIKT